MEIITYNLNGVRAALRKGLEDWIRDHPFDLICIQETKAQPEQVDLSGFEEMGYTPIWNSADKKGYSGTLTLTKEEPAKVGFGMDNDHNESEGRIIRTDFGDLTVLNCYIPSGTTGDVRQTVKMEFLEDFHNYIRELRKDRPHLIIVGDYNIAHTPNDIHNPKRNKKTSGFLPEEREWMTQWFGDGFTDAFRHHYPDKTEYSWWSYRARSRERNKGWRIDYQSVSDHLTGQIVDARQLTEVVHSDHCPVWMEVEVEDLISS